MTFRIVGKAVVVVLLLALIGLGVWMVVSYGLAEYYLRQGNAAIERQRYPQALTAYETALRYRPGSARLYLLAGRTARRSGKIQIARQHLQRCRELQEGVNEEQQLEEYLLRAQTGEVDQVQRFVVPYLIHEGPLTPLVLEAMARAYTGNYQTGLAWRSLSRWLELEPNNVEAIFRRGLWYALQTSTKEAKEDYARALELDPERVDVRLALAELLKAERKQNEVAEQYQLVLKLEPHNPTALLGLAHCYADMGRTSEARTLLDAIPADRQTDADVYWIRGLVEMQEEHFESAETCFRKALAREPRHREACYNLMRCLRSLRRETEANEQRALLASIEKDEKRIIQLTTKDMSASPTDPALPCELGEIYLRFGMTARALHWLHHALKLDPNYRRAHEQLRDYYDTLGAEGKEQADLHRLALKGSQ